MSNFFDIIKSIYTKKDIVGEIDLFTCMTVSKWLSYDKDNLPYLKKIMGFIYYMEPINYYYLLLLNIPKKYRVPFLKKIEKEKENKDVLVERVQSLLQWSDRELCVHYPLLQRTILKNRKYWEREFGIK